MLNEPGKGYLVSEAKLSHQVSELESHRTCTGQCKMKIEPLLFQQFCRMEEHIKAFFSHEPGNPQYLTGSTHPDGSFPVSFQKEPVISKQEFARISSSKACQVADIRFRLGPYEKSIMNLFRKRAVRGINVTGPCRKAERNPGQPDRPPRRLWPVRWPRANEYVEYPIPQTVSRA